MAFMAALAPFIGPAITAGAGMFMNRKNRNMPNPAEQAMPYLNQVPEAAGQYMRPFIQRGERAGEMAPNYYQQMYEQSAGLPDLYANPNINFNEAPPGYAEMSKDPQAYINKIQAGYEPSKGYQYRKQRMLDEMRSAAAHGGFVGTQADEQRRAEEVGGLLGQDMQQWLQNVTGVHGQGMAGEERRIGRLQGGLERMLAGRARTQELGYQGRMQALQNLARNREMAEQRGFEAAQGMAQVGTGNLGQQAGLRFQGQRQMNADRAARRRQMMQMFAQGAAMLPSQYGGMNDYYGGQGTYGGVGTYGAHSPGGNVARGLYR